MKTLVDTSVWIQHFRKSDSRLILLLEKNEAYLHPFVLQELYLGKPKNKNYVFERLSKLPIVSVLTDEQVFQFIDSHKIIGQGIGLVDTHLLGASYLQKLGLYTLDKKLSRLALALK